MIRKLLKRLNRYLSCFLDERNGDSRFLFKRVSHSQCGEDIIVDYLLNLRQIHNPSYLDIGAHHPVFLNNTFLLYSKGARGVNVEANKYLLESFNIYRNEDTNLNIGIGSRKEVKKFYVFEDSTLSTFSLEECNLLINSGHVLKEILDVNMLTISEIFNTYFEGRASDILFLDVEGLDFEIIKTIDFAQYRPLIICVESHFYDKIGMGDKNMSMCEYLLSQDYLEYADTGLNSIFIDKLVWKS